MLYNPRWLRTILQKPLTTLFYLTAMRKFILCHAFGLSPSKQASHKIFEKGRSLSQISLSLSLSLSFSLNTKIVSKKGAYLARGRERVRVFIQSHFAPQQRTLMNHLFLIHPQQRCLTFVTLVSICIIPIWTYYSLGLASGGCNTRQEIT